MDKTNFENTDLSWSLAFDVNLHAANLKGAQTSTLATHISQITSEGSNHIREAFGRSKGSIPFSLWLEIRHSVERVEQAVQSSNKVSKAVSNYGVKRIGSESAYGHGKGTEYENTGDELYTEKPPYGFETLYRRGFRRETKDEYK